jgi:hypothetical protein
VFEHRFPGEHLGVELRFVADLLAKLLHDGVLSEVLDAGVVVRLRRAHLSDADDDFDVLGVESCDDLSGLAVHKRDGHAIAP